jgi:hypothetical protein
MAAYMQENGGRRLQQLVVVWEFLRESEFAHSDGPQVLVKSQASTVSSAVAARTA